MGGGITYADICVASILHGVSKRFPDVWSQVCMQALTLFPGRNCVALRVLSRYIPKNISDLFKI